MAALLAVNAKSLVRLSEQLKHGCPECPLVGGAGIEPATSCVSSRRSTAELTAPVTRNVTSKTRKANNSKGFQAHVPTMSTKRKARKAKKINVYKGNTRGRKSNRLQKVETNSGQEESEHESLVLLIDWLQF